ncbi:LysR family transcriptional regulator [Actinomadura sp. DC4]|uniref:LysR family transcriptional regulator n=1 Tax=Actinomadura sp. DC4 TaxID=3055069 RepID=UPI0025B03352|nr:LysR family transcriptional regulator [Actinomadura sp. DC4]MDN3359384.1 LysR family transcriptional regulator [Actinomadura sp. DC4]
MSLRRLRYFVTVADARSFTAAAKALHMAQPPLSTQIRELEHELGAELFHRAHRGVTLTAAGQAVLPEARRLLERYDLIGHLARRAAAGEVGRLAIGLIPSAVNGRLPDVLNRFRERLPDVEVALTEDRPPELLRQLAGGHIDVALLYSRPDDDAFAGRVIGTEALVLAVPAGHPFARRESVPVRALAGQPLILPTRHGGEGLYERITRLLADHGVTTRVVQSDIWMMQTIVGLVSAGAGLAIVPESAMVIRSSQISYRPLADRIEPVPLVAVWRRADDLPTVHRFVGEWPSPSSSGLG